MAIKEESIIHLRWKEKYQSRVALHVGYLMGDMEKDEVLLFEQRCMIPELLIVASNLMMAHSIGELGSLLESFQVMTPIFTEPVMGGGKAN